MSKEPEGPQKPDPHQTGSQAESPDISHNPETPQQESPPEVDCEDGQAGVSEPKQHEDDSSWHDDPHHHDYEHEDHNSYDEHHDEHYYHGHEASQGDDNKRPSDSANVSVSRDDWSDGDDTLPDLDEDGEAFGGPVKSFLEHMEDLRWTLIRCVASVFVAMVVCLAGAPYLVETLAWPLTKAKQSLTENREGSLLKEDKSDILLRLTEKETLRLPIQSDLLEEARNQLNLPENYFLLRY